MFSDEQIILLDTEYTSWEGCIDTGWDNDKGQYRELVQVAALRVDTETLAATGEFDRFIRPQINPELSEYFKNLTGIRQTDVDSAEEFTSVATDFLDWIGPHPVYSYGNDITVLERNVELYDANIDFDREQFRDVCKILKKHGVPVEEYTSGTVCDHFGVEPDESGSVHEALYDCRSVLAALRAARNND